MTVVDVKTGAVRPVGPESFIDATFSPDGRDIVYRDLNEHSIYSMDLKGQNRKLLAHSDFFAVSPLLP